MDPFVDRAINQQMSLPPRPNLEKHSKPSGLAMASEDQQLFDQEGNKSFPSSSF